LTDEPPRPCVKRRRLSRGSLAWLAVTGLLAAIGFAALVFPPEQAGRMSGALPAFDAQGHRGARGLYPENSLPGFAAALGLGVSTLEMDLAMTRDRVLVVHHDRRLDPGRTRGPDGAWLEAPTPAIFELTRAGLAAFDVGRLRPGSRAAERFADQRGGDGVAIPTLAEVFALAEARSGGTVRYNLEIKTSPLAPEETVAPEAFAEALIAALIQAGVVRRAMVQSFDWRALARVQAIAPEISTVYLSAEESWLDNLERGRPGVSPWAAGFDVDRFDGSTPRTVKAAGGAVWSPYYRGLRAAELREAHNLGLKVVVWTVNEAADMASLIDLGVDGIITDYPDRLRRVMAEKGLALPPTFPERDSGKAG
jgi:glycerophosphoryl diester phosphodiesterase